MFVECAESKYGMPRASQFHGEELNVCSTAVGKRTLSHFATSRRVITFACMNNEQYLSTFFRIWPDDQMREGDTPSNGKCSMLRTVEPITNLKHTNQLSIGKCVCMYRATI